MAKRNGSDRRIMKCSPVDEGFHTMLILHVFNVGQFTDA